jgi:ABC-2 type transport system permease protein
MARSFIQERDLGTLRRLRMAPVRPASILLGKTVPFLMLSLLQTAILFACGRWMFGMTWGPLPWLLVPVALCTSLAATSLGLLIATLVRTDSQVSAYANIVVILSAGISGCFIPRQWLTPVMKPVSLAVPHGWALVAYDTLLKSARPDVTLVWQCCAAILGFALLYFLLGTRFFAKLD